MKASRREGALAELHVALDTALAMDGRGSAARKADGAVYTPADLADLVIGRVLAAHGPTVPRRILDPACGGGHFLVAAWKAIRKRCAGDPPVARLFGVERDPTAAAAARRVLEVCALIDALELGTARATPAVWLGDALLPEGTNPDWLQKGFDAVIGNPPYVRIDRLDLGYRAALMARHFAILAGKWDLYHCFLAQALDWLAEGGVLGFVTPNQYLLGASARRLRARLAHDVTVCDVLDLCGLESFSRAIPPAAITVLQNRKPPAEHRVRLEVRLPGPWTAKGEVRQEAWRAGTWSILAPDPFLRWLAKLGAPALADLCPAITEGDTRRSEEARVLPAAEAPADWRPVVRGRDVGPLLVRIDPRGDRLPPRAGPPRILIRDVAPRLVASPAPEGVRCLRTVYCAVPRDPDQCARIAALLCTDLMTWIYVRLFYSSKMSPRAANFRFQAQFLEPLPILLPPEGSLADTAAWALDAYGVAAIDRRALADLLRRLGAS